MVNILSRMKLRYSHISLGLLIFGACTQLAFSQHRLFAAASVANTNSVQQKSNKQPIALNTGDLENVDALMKQLGRMGPEERELGLALLKNARELEARTRREGRKFRRGFSVTAANYGNSAVYYPTTEALLGYAEFRIMAPDDYEVKLRRFKASAKVYRAAIQLGERTGKPLTAQQRRNANESANCLETFIKKPNQKSPPCKLVADALKQKP
jgi:hypothetical protein